MILVHPAAVAEAREARRRYATYDPAAGQRFLTEYDRVITQIQERPTRWPRYPHLVDSADEFRWCRFRRFPFAIIYEHFTTITHVLAVAADRQRPGYWMNRR
jgi:hypothetical protein